MDSQNENKYQNLKVAEYYHNKSINQSKYQTIKIYTILQILCGIILTLK